MYTGQRYDHYRVVMVRLVVFIGLLIAEIGKAPMVAAQEPTATAQEQCAKGVRLVIEEQKFAEALPLLEDGFAARAQATFAKPEDLGVCGFALGQARRFAGDQEGALVAFEAALEAFRKGSNQGYLPPALSAIGEANYELRRFAEAEAAFQEAARLAQVDGSEAAQAVALSGLTRLYDDQARYNDLIALHSQRMPLLKKPSEQVNALLIVGKAYYQLGRFTEASDVFDQALAINREQKESRDEAITLTKIGELLSVQGRSLEATRSFEQALAIYEADGRQRDPLLLFAKLNVKSNLAQQLRLEGRYGAALVYLQQALAELEGLPPRRLDANTLLATKGQLLNDMGVTYLDQGNTIAAEEHIAQALDIALQQGNPRDEAIRRINRGSVFERRANSMANQAEQQTSYAQALAEYRAALTIAETHELDTLQFTALNNMGVLLVRQDRRDEALTLQTQALAISRLMNIPANTALALVNIGTINHDQQRYTEALTHFEEALKIATNIGSSITQAEALARIARTLELQNKDAAALAQYEQAMGVLGQMRATAGDAQARAGFIASYADVYERAARLYLQQPDPSAAFETVERGRARSFLDSLSTGETLLADTESTTLLETIRSLDAQQEALRRELATVRQASSADAALIARLETQLATVQQDYTEAVSTVQASGNQVATLLPSMSGTIRSPKEIQPLLAPETTLLAYQVGAETTLAFVMTQTTLDAKELPIGRAALTTLVSNFRSFNDPAAAQALDIQLIEPLEASLNTSHLLIIPHDVLHYIPFAALGDGQQTLLDTYEVTTIPAASVLPFVQSNAAAATGGEVLVLAHPDGPTFAAGLVTAAESVGTLFGVTPLLHTAATETALRARSPGAQILHIGAHGTFDTIVPLESALLLAPSASDDGRLTVGEVYGLNLNRAELVVLSGCETLTDQRIDPDAPSAVTAGDELVGLTRAFFYAGTPTVIATLWQVDDAASQLLMERFYTHLKAGVSKAEALRLAQQEVRAQYPSPRDWAGFVLVGDGGEITPLPLPWGLWLIGGAALLLVLLGAGIVWWRKRTHDTIATADRYAAQTVHGVMKTKDP
jgi:CHAT domain-containing protein